MSGLYLTYGHCYGLYIASLTAFHFSLSSLISDHWSLAIRRGTPSELKWKLLVSLWVVESLATNYWTTNEMLWDMCWHIDLSFEELCLHSLHSRHSSAHDLWQQLLTTRSEAKNRCNHKNNEFAHRSVRLS